MHTDFSFYLLIFEQIILRIEHNAKLMNIPAPLLKHIDEKSIELVELLDKVELPSRIKQEPTGSMGEKIPLDWSDKIGDSNSKVYSALDYKNRKIDIWYEMDGHKIGYDLEKYKIYSKFVESLHKKRFHSFVTNDFLESNIFNWVLETHLNGKAATNLSEYIVQIIEGSIVTRTYSFPILYLEIPTFLKVGPVSIRYFTKDNFDESEAIYARENDGKKNSGFLRKQFQGVVLASVEETAQSDRGAELAFEKCSLAVDLLKIYSKTFSRPDIILDFDIDSRAKTQTNNYIFSQVTGSMEDLTVSLHKRFETNRIDTMDLQRMHDMQFGFITQFAFSNEEQSELSGMIINAIKNFANALSNRDLNKRIAELCSIYESLLVPDKQAHILESLKKYGPKIVTTDLERRKELKKLITDFYDIRCALIHHGQHEEFDMLQLSRFQYTLLYLILNLIQKSKTHKKKIEVLTEIDEAIHAA
jgi:hypothetical protein